MPPNESKSRLRSKPIMVKSSVFPALRRQHTTESIIFFTLAARSVLTLYTAHHPAPGFNSLNTLISGRFCQSPHLLEVVSALLFLADAEANAHRRDETAQQLQHVLGTGGFGVRRLAPPLFPFSMNTIGLSGDLMRLIGGRIHSFLTNSTGEINGVVLDSGQAAAFPPEKTNELFSVVTLGSRVEIEALTPNGSDGDLPATAISITDLLSNQTVFLNMVPTEKPEVYADVYPPPGTASPLAPTSEISAAERDNRARAAIPEKVTNAIERARDRLHRSHAMLGFLKAANKEKSFLLQYLQEAKKTYLQALGRYRAGDFEGAHECAAASFELSDMIETLISRTFHSTAPTGQETNSQAASAAPGADKMKASTLKSNIERIDHQLERIQWVAANGTLPSEDREQVQKLVFWSERLKGWACCLLDIGAGEEAGEFAHAAEAAAGAAEHVCKKCYVTRCDCRVTAAG